MIVNITNVNRKWSEKRKKGLLICQQLCKRFGPDFKGSWAMEMRVVKPTIVQVVFVGEHLREGFKKIQNFSPPSQKKKKTFHKGVVEHFL